MIDVIKVGKVYGLRPVLKGISFSVPEGQFVSLMGPNGAGKTTLLRMISTLLKPTNGQVKVAGLVLPQQAGAVRQMLGVVSHNPLLYTDLTADENLRLFARLYDVVDAQVRIAAVLEQVGLIRRRSELVRNYSRGMVQRLAIARAILHDPQVMLFDEPYTGLDQDASAMLDGVLKSVAAAGRTVVMTTHNLQRGATLADRVLILSRGKLAFDRMTREFAAGDFPALYAETIHA